MTQATEATSVDNSDMDLYAQLKAAGIEMDNHESDLYVRDGEESRRIIESIRPKLSKSRFTSAIDGKPWFDIPFMYTPFWTSKAMYKPLA